MQFGEMQLRAVAFVLAEAILRETGAEVTHHLVTRHLCDHARGGDRQTDAVAVNDRRLRKWKRKHGQAVNEDVLSRRIDCGDGRAHRLVRSAENVDPIDFSMVDYPDCPDHIAVSCKIDINFFPQLRRELFGVVQLPVPKILRKKDGRGDNPPGERATTGLINAGDTNHADGAQFLFVTKAAPAIHFDRRLR
jgi:hypothetical protein